MARPFVIASEAKQSAQPTNIFYESMDCFVATLLAMTGGGILFFKIKLAFLLNIIYNLFKNFLCFLKLLCVILNYYLSMKRIIALCLIAIFSLSAFAQKSRGYEDSLITQIVTKQAGSSVQINIFFSESINPRTLVPQAILINGVPLNPNTKFMFNREGTQVRFNIEFTGSFTLKLNHLMTNSGREISTGTIALNGDSIWPRKES